MKHRLEIKVVKTLEQLKIEIQDIWDNLSIAFINRLIDTMPKRLNFCAFEFYAQCIWLEKKYNGF